MTIYIYIYIYIYYIYLVVRLLNALLLRYNPVLPVLELVNRWLNRYPSQRFLVGMVARQTLCKIKHPVGGRKKLFCSTTIKYIIPASVWPPVLCQVIQLGEEKLWYNGCNWHDYSLSCFRLTVDNHEDFADMTSLKHVVIYHDINSKSLNLTWLLCPPGTRTDSCI